MTTGRLLGSLDIPGTVTAPATARHYLREVLDPAHHAIDDVTLLASELVTNAVVHTASGRGGTIKVNVSECPGGGIMVEVADEGGPTLPVPRACGDEFDLHGRGLLLVDRLAATWGHEQAGAGSTIWFVVDPH